MTRKYPVINKQATGNRLHTLMESKGITARDIQDYLGLGCVQSVYRWLSGKSMPTIDNLYALSELFQVSIDNIICGDRKLKPVSSSTSNSQYIRILNYYNKLSKPSVA